MFGLQSGSLPIIVKLKKKLEIMWRKGYEKNRASTGKQYRDSTNRKKLKQTSTKLAFSFGTVSLERHRQVDEPSSGGQWSDKSHRGTRNFVGIANKRTCRPHKDHVIGVSCGQEALMQRKAPLSRNRRPVPTSEPQIPSMVRQHSVCGVHAALIPALSCKLSWPKPRCDSAVN